MESSNSSPPDDPQYLSDVQSFFEGLEELYSSREFSHSEVQLALLRSLVTLGEMNQLLSEFEGSIRKLPKSAEYPVHRLRVAVKNLGINLTSFTSDVVFVYGPVVKVLDVQDGVDSIHRLMQLVKKREKRR